MDKTPWARGLLIGLFVILFILATRAIPLYVDWLWFLEIDYTSVFTTILLAKLSLGGLTGLAFFVILYASLMVARRHEPGAIWDLAENQIVIPQREMLVPMIPKIILGVTFVMSLLAGLNGAVLWERVLVFRNAVPFNLTDPLFGKDLGFYVFQLPFLSTVQGWLFTTLMLTTLLTLLVYVFQQGIRVGPKGLSIDKGPQRHLAILVSLLLVLKAWDFSLSTYRLLFSDRGVVFGATYTDIHAALPALQFLVLVSLVAAAVALYGGIRGSWKLPVGAVAAVIVLSILGQSVYPNLLQKFRVVPNEITMEKPYILENIKYSRYGYGLNRIEAKDFPASENLSLKDINANDLTIKNVRLWDHRPLLATYKQLQQIRTYYDFVDVDNDRYMIDGELRQVMVSPRELSYTNLPSRIWINEHITYTHGHGITMGPVNQISPQGLPIFFIKDIPPVSSKPEIPVKRPEIYYGEIGNDYVFVKTKSSEFDYPAGDKNEYTRYAGTGGVPMEGLLRKAVFATYFGAAKILLSTDVVPETRILYNRNILSRASKLTPFLTFDQDPYMVVSKDGRLFWILDGYTTSSMIPYSHPSQMGNYIRNSVKVVLDAYHGSMDYYISDPEDPLVKVYSKIFPGLFQPLEKMPADLRSHIRYPQDFFRLQAEMFGIYHMQDPQIFYNKEDLWNIPKRSISGSETLMDPYYTIMKLPGETKEEFIQLIAYTPSRRDNMTAWLAARSDGDHYGKLIVYLFPKQKLIYGPRQVDARIDQDAVISQQLTLWSQRGSQVIRGSLLVIPIEQSLLYIEPLYLAAQAGSLPELRRVIAVYGDQLVMESNLESALSVLFGGKISQPMTTTSGGGAPVQAVSQANRIAQALTHYNQAQTYLRQGNFAGYGEEIKSLEGILQELSKQSKK